MGSGGKHTSAVIQARSDDNNLNAPQSKKMEIPSGFHAYRWHMLSGFFFLSVIYFGTIAAFDTIRDFLQLPPSSPELCENQQEELCWRADLFAFEIVSGVALAWCGILGVWAWHIQRTHLVPATPEGRLFGYLPEAHQLTALGTTFQVFDLCISLIIPEQRQPLFLCHHIMAATVSWYGLNNQVRCILRIANKEEVHLQCWVLYWWLCCRRLLKISPKSSIRPSIHPFSVLPLLWNLLFGMFGDFHHPSCRY